MRRGSFLMLTLALGLVLMAGPGCGARLDETWGHSGDTPSDDDTADDDDSSGDDDSGDDDSGDDDTTPPLVCPTAGEPVELGAVAYAGVDETSGVVESRDHPGVLWVHNDSGDAPRLYAMATDGTHLGVYTLADVPTGDWEDLALGLDPVSGDSILYVGDVGDNGHNRPYVRVHRVVEPEVAPDQAPVEVDLASITMRLTYPDGISYDSETLLADPITDDLLVVTKSSNGDAHVYRKAPPHEDEVETELEHVTDLDFSVAPLSGGATTGGDLAFHGHWIVIRTYIPVAYLWLWDREDSLAKAFSEEPCAVPLPWQQQGESIGFAADGAGLFTISEGDAATVWFVPLDDGRGPPAP